MPRGRPSKFKPEFVDQARKLAELGATDREIADFFDVTEVTINRWKATNAEFCSSIKVGKQAADDRVEQSLYRKATGYSFDSEKIFQYEGEVIRAATVEHVPPSDTAAIFWLKNRRKDEWRDRHDVQHSIDGDLAAVFKAASARVDSGKQTIYLGEPE